MDPRLYRYANSSDVHSLKELLHTDPSVLLRRTPQGNTALHVAARSGQTPVFVEIYSRCKSLLMQPNSEGDTPLHVASGAGHLSVVKFLVTEIKSTSPFQLDIESGCNRRFEMLRWGNKRNNTVLAARGGMKEVVGWILTSCPLSAHGGSDGQTALHAAVSARHSGNSLFLDLE